MSSPALGVPLALLSTTGLLLNGYILFVIILTRQSATANNLLLLHLGVVDSLLGVLFLTFAAPALATRNTWLSSGAPCTLHGFLFTLLHPVALWTICGLNCDRYYAIAAPLHYAALVNPRKVTLGLGLAWFIAFALCIPPLLTIAPYKYNPFLGACAPDFSSGDGVFWYSITYSIFTLLLPSLLILGCNIKVLMIARYHRHRIASAIYEVTLSAQVTITHQRNPFFVPTVTAPSAGGPPKFRGRSAISTVLQLLGSLVVLYFPYYGVITWTSVLSTFSVSLPKIHPLIMTIATVLLTCSPPINGLLYGVKSKTLRKTFQNYWRKQMSKNEMNQEIQARTPSTCGSRRPSLTPLGLLTKPLLQRRLSEALLDVNKQGSPQKTKMKRIASELSWRPESSTGILLFSSENSHRTIPHTSSCNTLQVPNHDGDDVSAAIADEELYLSFKAFKDGSDDAKLKLSTKNVLLQRVFGIETCPVPTKRPSAIQTVLQPTPARRSPRILITRAFSEESDKTPSASESPSRTSVPIMSRKHSISATTLLERKWRTLRPQSIDEDSDSSDVVLHRPIRAPFVANRSSDSSTASDASSGRMYMSLDERFSFSHTDGTDSDGLAVEEPLLSWPAATKPSGKHSKGFFMKQKSIVENNIGAELVL